MDAAQVLENIVIEALDADAQAVGAPFPEFLEVFPVHGAGIYLNGEFLRLPEDAFQQSHEGAHLVKAQSRGRTAPQIKGGGPAMLQHHFLPPHQGLYPQGIHISLPGFFPAPIGGKVTVIALPATERNVYISSPLHKIFHLIAQNTKKPSPMGKVPR